MTDLLPILHEIDLRVELELAFALRKAARPWRSEIAKKGQKTRRDRDAALRKAAGFEAVGQQPGDALQRGNRPILPLFPNPRRIG